MSEFQVQLSEFITQGIAFLIFFWVMKRFAWPALTSVLEERQNKIEEGFAEIDRKKAEAQQTYDEYHQRLRDIEAEARTKVQEAVAEGRRVAAEIAEQARTDAAATTERAQRAMEIELAKARVELRDEIVQMTLTASERLLRTKMDDAAQRKLVGDFLGDLERAGNQDRN